MDSVRVLATRRKVAIMRLFEINDEGQFEYMQDDYAALGKRIQEVRKARKLSQNELADMVAGCNRKRISSIENGSSTITVGELFCIAMELEESANYLITVGL
jgi:DNA-binding XRE family transcriptional regulator